VSQQHTRTGHAADSPEDDAQSETPHPTFPSPQQPTATATTTTTTTTATLPTTTTPSVHDGTKTQMMLEDFGLTTADEPSSPESRSSYSSDSEGTSAEPNELLNLGPMATTPPPTFTNHTAASDEEASPIQRSWLSGSEAVAEITGPPVVAVFDESDIEFSDDNILGDDESDSGGGEGGGRRLFTMSPEVLQREAEKIRNLSRSLAPSASPAAPSTPAGGSGGYGGEEAGRTAGRSKVSPAASELAEFMDELQDLNDSTFSSHAMPYSPSGALRLGGGDSTRDNIGGEGAGERRPSLVALALSANANANDNASAGAGAGAGAGADASKGAGVGVLRGGLGATPADSPDRLSPRAPSANSPNTVHSGEGGGGGATTDPRRSDQRMVVVPAGSQSAHTIAVQCNGPAGTSVISWEFFGESTVVFGIYLKDTPTSTKQKKWAACVPLREYDAAAGPQIGSWSCAKSGVYVMMFTNTSNSVKARMFVRAHVLDLTEWEDGRMLALHGLVKRRVVTADEGPEESDRLTDSFAPTPLFNLDLDELQALVLWLNIAIGNENMSLMEGLGERDDLSEQHEMLEHRLDQTARTHGFDGAEAYLTTVVNEPQGESSAGKWEGYQDTENEGDGVPYIFQCCVDYLSQPKVLREVGLFRVSGSRAEIAALASRFDDPGPGATLDDVVDPAAVCGLLRVVMMESELPLSPTDAYALAVACTIKPKADSIEAIRDVLCTISPAGYAGLSMIVRLFQLILDEPSNKMTLRNLGLTIGLTAFPGIERPDEVIQSLTSAYAEFFGTEAADSEWGEIPLDESVGNIAEKKGIVNNTLV
jgi:hypothetical protein